MSSANGGYKSCPFDGKACPPKDDPEYTAATGSKTACNYYFDCRAFAYGWLVCDRHPEKAKTVVEESQANYFRREAVPASEWEVLNRDFDSIMSVAKDLPEDEKQAMLAPWYAKRDAVIDKYNPA
jgi:hypothetical protein